MPLVIKHNKIATYADEPGAEINKAEWNDSHSIAGTILVDGTTITGDGITIPLSAVAGGSGDVTGPGSSADGNITLFNGVTGKVIKDSGVQISALLTTTSAAATYLPLAGGTMTGDVIYDTGAQVLLDDSVTAAGANLPLAFDGDGDTGMFRSAANQFGLVAGATEVIRIQQGTLTGARLFRAIYFSNASNMASATNMDLGTATGNTVNITGTTTIVSLGSTASLGSRFVVKFTGILTITYDATNLILPTSGNIVTAVGDTAEFHYYTAGGWQCVWYQRASGVALVQSAPPFNTITSGTNTIAAMTVGSGASFTYSGTGTITATHAAVANEATDTTCFPLFATTATGDQAIKSNASFTYNSNTGNVGAVTFTGAFVGNVTGNVSGNAATVTTNANLTGVITSVGNTTSFGTFTSAQLAAGLSDETGTGAAVFSNSPVLVTPNLGTPSAAILTSATGLPISTGVSGLGSGVATFLATPSSANLAAAVTGETGSGALVFGTSPTITGATLTTSSINGVNPTTAGSATTYLNAAGAYTTPAGGGSSPLTTKGDLYTFSTVDNRLPVGMNGYQLIPDSTQTNGINWSRPYTDPKWNVVAFSDFVETAAKSEFLSVILGTSASIIDNGLGASFTNGAGFVSIGTGTTATGTAGLTFAQSNLTFVSAGRIGSVYSRFFSSTLPNGTDDYYFFLGFTTTNTAVDVTAANNSYGFYFSNANANYQLFKRVSGVNTFVDTGIAKTNASPVLVEFIVTGNATAGSVGLELFINGASVATSTGIGTGNVVPWAVCRKILGTASRLIDLDFLGAAFSFGNTARF